MPEGWEAAVIDTRALYDTIYNAAALMARVGHLDRSKRQDIERITRVVRESFDSAGVLHPKPKISRIMLTGLYARRTCDRADGYPDPPSYEFWIIVSDRLFTHKRLWQATEARIAEELGDRCTVSLSFNSAAGFKAGKRDGDEYIRDRLDACITLYRAKRDDPLSRRGKGTGIWTETLARFDAADAAFLPACATFRDAEHAYFAKRAEQGRDLSTEEDDALEIETGPNVAMAAEQRLGALRHEACMALLHTPAPDFAAIIRKLELVRDEGDGDDHAVVSILADVRWIAARIASRETPA
jgi:hypothetical protein